MRACEGWEGRVRKERAGGEDEEDWKEERREDWMEEEGWFGRVGTF